MDAPTKHGPPATAKNFGSVECVAWRPCIQTPSLTLLPFNADHSLLAICRYGAYPGAAGMDSLPLPLSGMGGSVDPLEAILGPFPCARLRNLPQEATLEDVLVFFQGLVVLDVILQGDGEAFVVFANPMDFQMALQRYAIDNLSSGKCHSPTHMIAFIVLLSFQ